MKLALLSTTPLCRVSASSRKGFAAAGFAAIAIAVAACSGNGTTGSSNPILPLVKPGKTATPPPYTFTFAPVNHTDGSGDDTRVTGIDERSSIVVGMNGTTPSTYSSWTAHTPLPKSTGFRYFRSKDYPGAVGTYMATESNGFFQAGTVFSPPPSGSLQCNACGVLHNNKGNGTGYGTGECGSGPCEWTFFQDPNEGTGGCAATEINGISDSQVVVGYYLRGASSCGSVGFEAYYNTGGEYFADFSVPGADPNTTQATGMNEEGDVVGTASFNGHVQGWYYKEASYCTELSAPNAKATYPTGINWEDQVVGYYTDSQDQTHGFMLLDPSKPPSHQVWESVDDPLAANYTVVSHINTHHTITGWYKDAYGTLHGFVGTCTSSNCTASKVRGSDSGPRGASGKSTCMPSGSLKWRRR